jgi:hypothetical protein
MLVVGRLLLSMDSQKDGSENFVKKSLGPVTVEQKSRGNLFSSFVQVLAVEFEGF